MYFPEGFACFAPSIANGNAVSNLSGFPTIVLVNQTATITCDFGFVLSGASVVLCHDNLTFVPEPGVCSIGKVLHSLYCYEITVQRLTILKINFVHLGKKHFFWLAGPVATIVPNSGADPGFGQGSGPQFPRPKVANVAKGSCASKVNYLYPGSRACLMAMEAFEFLMLEYAFSNILNILKQFLLVEK